MAWTVAGDSRLGTGGAMRAVGVVALAGMLACWAADAAGADADRDYQAALALMGRKEFGAAAELFAQFVARHTGHERRNEAIFRLGECRVQEGEDEEAALAFGRLTSMRPPPEDDLLRKAYLALGDASMRLKEHGAAINAYAALIETFPKSEEAIAAHYWRAEAYAQLKHYDSAIGHFEDYVKRFPEDERVPEAMQALAWCHFQLEQWDAARSWHEKLIKQFPDSDLVPASRFGIGETYYSERKYEMAREAFAAVREHFPDHELARRALVTMAWCDYDSGRNKDAGDLFIKAAKHQPETSLALESRFHAGCAYQDGGRTDLAIQQFELVAGAREHPLRARALFRLGMSYRQREGADKAALTRSVDAFRLALEEATEESFAAEVASYLGDVLFELGRYAEAAQALAQVARRDPTSKRAPWAMYNLALALDKTGETERAVEVGRRSLEAYPTGGYAVQTRFALGEFLSRLGRYAESRRQYETIAAAGPDQALAAESQFRIGRCLVSEGKRRQAMEAFATVLEKHPTSELAPDAGVRAGDLALDLALNLSAGAAQTTDAGRRATMNAEARALVERAAGLFQRVLDDYAGSPAARMALHGLALARMRQQDHAAAVDLLDRYLATYGDETERTGPLYASALFHRGESLYALNKYEEAVDSFASQLAADPDGPLADDGLYAMGWCYLKLTKTADAQRTFERLVREHPDAPEVAEALFLVARGKAEQGRYDEAVAEYDRLMKEFPASEYASRALLKRGAALYEAGRYDKAARTLERFAQDYPKHEDHAVGLYDLAWSYHQLEEADKEQQVLRRLIEQHPEFRLIGEVRFQLGELLYRNRQFASAMQQYEAAIKAQPAGILDQIYYKAAWAMLQLERREEAASAFDDVATRFPRSGLAAESLFRAGEIRLDLGRPAKAIGTYQALLDRYQRSEHARAAFYRKADCQLRMGKNEDALATASAFLNQYQQGELVPETWFVAGKAAFNLGDMEKAAASYEKTIADHDGEAAARAQLGLGEIALAQGRLDEARAHFLKTDLLYDYPEWSARALLGAATCAEKMNDPEEAARRRREVLENYPRTEAARELLNTARPAP